MSGPQTEWNNEMPRVAKKQTHLSVPAGKSAEAEKMRQEMTMLRAEVAQLTQDVRSIQNFLKASITPVAPKDPEQPKKPAKKPAADGPAPDKE